MSSTGTIADLFQLAIQAEKDSAKAYRRLAQMFSHEPEVADFWAAYAAEEDGHAHWLQDLEADSNPDKLSQPVDAEMIETARQVARFPVDAALRKVQTLEDAYQLANEMEHSEINVVFQFLIDNFDTREDTYQFVRSHLHDHVAKLMTGFPGAFKNAAARRKLEARP